MGLTCPLFFCEFSLFLNIKYLQNIRDSKLNQAFSIGEAEFYEIFSQFLTKFNQNLMIGPCLWPTLPQTFMKIGAIRFEISWRQTNKQR